MLPRLIVIIFISLITNIATAEEGSIIARSLYKDDGTRRETVISDDKKTISEEIFNQTDKKIARIIYEKDKSGKIRLAKIFDIKQGKAEFRNIVFFGYDKMNRKREERMRDKSKKLIHWVIFTYHRGKPRKPTLIYLVDDSGKVVVNNTHLLKKTKKP